MLEVDHIKNILKETLQAIEENNPIKIKELSNQTIHSVSTNQDENNITIAVMIYSLSKIFQRPNYKSEKGWENFTRITKNSIQRSIKDLENNDLVKFKKDFSLISKAINKISGKLKKYIEDVLVKAKINKGSRIYEHGISLGKTAKLMGVTLFDLAGYTGQTGISEAPLNKTIDAKTRVKMLEEFFQ